MKRALLVMAVMGWLPAQAFAQACTGSGGCPAGVPVCNAGMTCEACTAGNGGEAVCQAAHAGTHCLVATGACVECLDNTQCASDPLKPACTANLCAACTSNAGCVGHTGKAFCDTSAGANMGACVACTTDDTCPLASAPHCASNACGACNPATAMHGDESCAHLADGGVPACQPSDGIASAPGQCKQCSVNNTSACGGATPACNFATGACQLCTVALGDLGGVSTGCASNANGHVCKGSGASVSCGCNTDADCGGSTSGRVCDSILGTCAAGCSPAASRNHCPAGQFCTTNDTTGAATGVCTTTCNFAADCASSMPFCVAPDGDAGVGRCAGCRTDADCSGATSVCDPATKVCVECTPQSKAACSATGTGGACLANNHCGCLIDADCGGNGRSCDPAHNCGIPPTDDLGVQVEPDMSAAMPPLYYDDGCGGCAVAHETPTTTGALLLVVLMLGAALLRRVSRRGGAGRSG